MVVAAMWLPSGRVTDLVMYHQPVADLLSETESFSRRSDVVAGRPGI